MLTAKDRIKVQSGPDLFPPMRTDIKGSPRSDDYHHIKNDDDFDAWLMSEL